MIYKIIFIIIFIFLLIYSLIRPFKSVFARLFLLFGSIAGILSLLGSNYANLVASYVGAENGTYLYLYIGLITIFMFIFYAINKISELESFIAKIVRELAILKAKSDNDHL